MSARRLALVRHCVVLVLAVAACSAGVAAPGDEGGVVATQERLLSLFRDPPDSARPRTWWHWMNGNITPAGIEADLEWMKRAGLGGAQVFDVSLGMPKVVDRPLGYMSPEWKAAFGLAASTADRLGLELSVAGSPGWSETGGPWVPPADGMKKLVWSETWVKGGQPFRGRLPPPPGTSGAFQDLGPGGLFATADPGFQHQGQVRVLALRMPKGSALPTPHLTSSGGTFTPSQLDDGRLAQGELLPMLPARQPAWLAFDYGRPVTVRGVTLACANEVAGWLPPPSSQFAFKLQASENAEDWRDVATLPGGPYQHTVSVPATTARHFRLAVTLLREGPRPAPFPGMPEVPAPTGVAIAEWVLHGHGVVHEAELKAGFVVSKDYHALATPALPSVAVVQRDDVFDITQQMSADGRLVWTPPPGTWKVLRIGYSLTGRVNHPAQTAATGPEVDKLDAGAVQRYIDHYLSLLRDASGGPNGNRAPHGMVLDSWEAGVGNWSPGLLSDFRRWRGYDPTPFLPALFGIVVESARASDKFLWDYRRTIMQAVKEHHYAVLARSLRAAGMVSYVEGQETLYNTLADGMEMKQFADVPMAAFWVGSLGIPMDGSHANDLRESASVAHLYGSNIVAAESFTTAQHPYGHSPATLKAAADFALTQGLNRFVIHTSAHQPDARAPGVSLGPFGQWFTRHETWAEQARPWIDYLARCSALLQQGHAVRDIALFYGESEPALAMRLDEPDLGLPAGHRYDYVNADALQTRLSTRDGRLVTPDGMSYRMLVLAGHSQQITLPTLRKLVELVRGGALLVGRRPMGSPSLADDPIAVRQAIDTLWPAGRDLVVLGRGRVYAHGDVARAGLDSAVVPDFAVESPASARVLFEHRQLADGDLYFLSQRGSDAQTLEAAFRVTGKVPELWDPVTGTRQPASYRIEGGVTHVSVPIASGGSVFVVFLRPTAEARHQLGETRFELLAQAQGPWQVLFQPSRGAPERTVFERLVDWRDHAQPGVRYFSGTATYDGVLELPPVTALAGMRLWLDLGRVEVLARVRVNGQDLGVTWHPPYRVDATAALRLGTNRIEIDVTNLWVNRLIGDAQPGTHTKIGWTAADAGPPGPGAIGPLPAFAPAAPLSPSGLLGPVEVVLEVR